MGAGPAEGPPESWLRGPRRPHPCGKDIMTFSLSDFFGYSMAVTSACDYLNLSPEDFHNWEVRLDGVRFISGSLSYDVSLRQLEKLAKRVQGKPKKLLHLLLCPVLLSSGFLVYLIVFILLMFLFLVLVMDTSLILFLPKIDFLPPWSPGGFLFTL